MLLQHAHTLLDVRCEELHYAAVGEARDVACAAGVERGERRDEELAQGWFHLMSGSASTAAARRLMATAAFCFSVPEHC